MRLHNFVKRIKDIVQYIKSNRCGEWIAPQPQEVCEMVIAGVTYLISPFYKDKGAATAIDKVARLIDKDAENSQ